MLCGNALQAQIINFDVPGGAWGFTNYSGQGAYSDPGNNFWNAIVNNGTTAAGNYSNGTSSPITLTCSSDSLYTGGQPGRARHAERAAIALLRRQARTEDLHPQ